MAYSHLEKRQIGTSGLEVTLLGLGTVSIAGWPNPISEEQAQSTVEAAWDAGVRLFDTAPMYGMGMAEERLGKILAPYPRDNYVISTKVGRIVEDAIDTTASSEQEEFWKGAPKRAYHFDFSYDGVMSSVEDSLRRLNTDRLDVLHIHDPDAHYGEAIDGAYKALDQLRREGSIKAVGAGMNQPEMLTQFAKDGVFDCFLLAGRYTLLDQSALAELLPLCEQKNTSIFIGGVFNSGILIDPSDDSHFDYVKLDDQWRENVLDHGVRVPKPHETHIYWLDRARRIKAVCDRHQVPMTAVAMQFSAAHPAVASVVVGAGRPERFVKNAELLAIDIPSDLWAELKHEGLVDPQAPTP